jgi:hypothetical protein
VLPVPAVAQLTPLSPCAFAQATNDAMLLAGMLGCTTMIDGATAIMPTGTSSREDFHEQAVCLEGTAKNRPQSKGWEASAHFGAPCDGLQAIPGFDDAHQLPILKNVVAAATGDELLAHIWRDGNGRDARVARHCGDVILMQYLPFADAKALAVYDAFERGAYQLVSATR